MRDTIAVTHRRSSPAYSNDLQRGDRTLRINFSAELGATEERRCAVRRVVYIAPDHDLAFLQVAPCRPRMEVVPVGDKIIPGHALAVVGFPPNEDTFYDPQSFAACFKDGFDHNGHGLKRMSLGHLEGMTASTLEHDCTTLGGSSGSVILDLVRAEAVGLNFGSSRTYEQARPTNLGVPGWVIRERLEQLEL